MEAKRTNRLILFALCPEFKFLTEESGRKLTFVRAGIIIEGMPELKDDVEAMAVWS
jgi:hypothetical protein